MRVKLAIWHLAHDACELLKKRDSCSNPEKQVSKLQAVLPGMESEVFDGTRSFFFFFCTNN